MKSKLRIVFLLSMIISSIFLIRIVLFKNEKKELINIATLPEKFMAEYLDEYKNIESSKKDNILIVTTLQDIDDNYGASNVISMPNNQYILQYEKEDDKNNALNKFKENKDIIGVDENEIVTFDSTSYNSWGIEKMALDSSIEVANNNNLPEVDVAIIDTGCDVDLVNKYYPGKIKETYNALNNSTSDMYDTNGHGTHIAGTIAEGTPENVKIIPIKVSDSGTQYISDIITAINYVVYYEKADVLNLSFGTYSNNTALYNAIESANQKNIISIAAAGNDNVSSEHYPSAFDNTISISSVDSDLNKSTFSNYGTTIDFAAPGTNIKSTLSSSMSLSENTDGDNDFEVISGTSMATPHAVNAVAILKSYNKNLTLDNVISILKNYAVKDIGNIGKDIYFGNGFIYFNSDSFCENKETDECEEYGVFKSSSKISATRIDVENANVTSKNYGTLNNLNPIQIKLTYDSETSTVVNLGDLKDALISGYDPYSLEEQTVTIKWEDMETSFQITNPTEWDSGWEYEIIDDNSIKIVGFTDFNTSEYKTKKLYIPETIDGYKVADISVNSDDSSIFASATKDSYEEIILPSSLTQISGSNTFANFESVVTITSLADSLNIIGENVFSNNASLAEIKGVISSLGENTFTNDFSLFNITLDDNITEIPAATFANCISLTNLTLPSHLKTIKDYAFYDAGFVIISLPNSVESIGAYSFAQIHNRTLKVINLSSNLKSIGDFALVGTLITSINLPNSLESIGNNAFASVQKLKSFNLPRNVTSLGTDMFIYCTSLETITVDTNNTVFDSRNNSNAIIETATNTLLYGSAKTVIPSSVKKIGRTAFYNISISELTIPDGITEIGFAAFYNTLIDNLYVPSSVNSIGASAFTKSNGYITVWLDTNSYAKSYAVTYEVPYEAINTSYIDISTDNLNYNAFDKVDTQVYVYFDRGINNNGTYEELKNTSGRREIIDNSNFEIIYPDNRDSFRYGDTTFKIHGTTNYQEEFEKTYNVTVSKIDPPYDVPTDLTAYLGNTLSEIILPSGFEWMNPDTIIESTGDLVFKAKYTPMDTINYNIIENIDISIFVENPKTTIIPNISISNKIYDGLTTIDLSTIFISNLESSEYSIISAFAENSDAKEQIAHITLRLTDEKYNDYTFDNNAQEKEFVIYFTIEPKRIFKPTKKDVEYIYSGEEITFEVLNYDEESMDITGNSGINAGTYNVTISLKNSNYVWNDNTNYDVILIYEINKKELYVVDSTEDTQVKYDGQKHSIDVDLAFDEGTTIRFMDELGEYTQESSPEYSDVGTYVIKYKLYMDENHTTYFNQKTLTITKNTIVNNSKDFEGIYDGNSHSITIDIDHSDYSIKYSINNTNYDLPELPMFKDIGEYTVNYKIIIPGYEDLEGSNKVKIYGIKEIDSSIILKDSFMIINDASFNRISNKITAYSKLSEFAHYNKSNELITSDALKTGDLIKVTLNGIKTYEYSISYLGDTSGDGKINYLDYVNIYNHIQKVKHPDANKKLLEGEYLLAADISGDNKISYLDYVKIYNKIKELKKGTN